jgi:hypothetical protein
MIEDKKPNEDRKNEPGPELTFEGDSFQEFVCRDVSKDAGYKPSLPLVPRLYMPESGQERPAS